MKAIILFLPFILLSFGISAQDIRLENASFEDEPQDATMPQRWHGCKKGSTPDILPGFWGVYLEPFDGETYVGLITREDGTYENIGQRLIEPIIKKECYKFSLQLAYSKAYANYNIPIRLRVYGGTSRCAKDQLLCESNNIIHTDWKTYNFQFFAKEKYDYIIFEAYYGKGISFPYNGNLLVDDVSVFKKCPRADVILPTNLKLVDRL